MIDLTKIKGKGEFRCPKCRIEISPDDETEDTYTVLEPVMNQDRLDKIVLRCNKCKSQIYMTGFHVLNKIK